MKYIVYEYSSIPVSITVTLENGKLFYRCESIQSFGRNMDIVKVEREITTQELQSIIENRGVQNKERVA